MLASRTPLGSYLAKDQEHETRMDVPLAFQRQPTEQEHKNL